MKVTVSIRNPDGVVRKFEDDYEWEDDRDPDADLPTATSKAIWQWTEGNYGCDCNRALFFVRAGEEPDPVNFPCSGKVPAFKIELRDPSGEVFYSELSK